MPPRIRILLPLRSRPLIQLPSRSILPLHRTISPQTRSASILSSLSDNKTAYSKRIRVGRGPSSGYGKTSGRGHKGQKQHGKVPAGFEGGQTPQIIVQGERGFKNVFTRDLATVPLTRIYSWIAQGRIDPTKPITVRELVESGCVGRPRHGIKLLASSLVHSNSLDAYLRSPAGEGTASTKPAFPGLKIVVSRASASAIEAVEKAGGEVVTRYYTRWAIQQILKGRMDPMISLLSDATATDTSATTPTPVAASANEESSTAAKSSSQKEAYKSDYMYRLPDPTARKQIEYYRDAAHRGYLAHTVEEGKSPSLFFRTPKEEAERRREFARQKRAGLKDKGGDTGLGKKKLENDTLW